MRCEGAFCGASYVVWASCVVWVHALQPVLLCESILWIVFCRIMTSFHFLQRSLAFIFCRIMCVKLGGGNAGQPRRCGPEIKGVLCHLLAPIVLYSIGTIERSGQL